jgi:hypothetical protein
MGSPKYSHYWVNKLRSLSVPPYTIDSGSENTYLPKNIG